MVELEKIEEVIKEFREETEEFNEKLKKMDEKLKKLETMLEKSQSVIDSLDLKEENKEPPRKVNSIPTMAEQVAGYTIDIGRSGDEYWYDRVSFLKTPNGKFYKAYYEGYMGTETFDEVTEEMVISEMNKAAERAKNTTPHEAYKSYDDYSVTQEYIPKSHSVHYKKVKKDMQEAPVFKGFDSTELQKINSKKDEIERD